MTKKSAGLLMYRQSHEEAEVFLVHPGGPFWARKDKGAWCIPKGEYAEGENAMAAAQREFTEETGFVAQQPFHDLGTIRQTGGKFVSAWAFEGDCDPKQLISNLCQIEWPPRSRQMIDIPEVDRGAWFSLAAAESYILKSQQPLLESLRSVLQRLEP